MVKNWVAGLAVILGVGLVALLAYSLLLGLGPAGVVAVASATEPFNDPKDLTPREPVLPQGPHLDEFLNNCTACHSTRLTMTQPKFQKEKWTEVVHKMVTAYGAKITPETESQIVQYLAATRIK